MAQIGRERMQRLGALGLPAPVVEPLRNIKPTKERRRHDVVERADANGHRELVDARGQVGNPFRVVDTLELMHRAGTITAAMRDAGRAFQDDFALAQLDALKAADMMRSSGGGGGTMLGHRSEAARDRVWRMIRAVGGIASPGGSCLWHVLGLGRSLSEWAKTQGWGGRLLDKKLAGGIMVATLGMLAENSS